jgi:hypothetical protein
VANATIVVEATSPIDLGFSKMVAELAVVV